jgi:hypothetical protein
VTNNTDGIHANATSGGSVVGTIRDGVAARNNVYGILAEAPSSSNGLVRLFVERTNSYDNLIGIKTNGPNANAVIGDTSVSENDYGLSASNNSQLWSYQTNRVSNNVLDGSPTLTLTHK